MNDNVIIYYNNVCRRNNIVARLEHGTTCIPNCYWCKTAFYTQLIDAKDTKKYNYNKVRSSFRSRTTKKYGMKDVLEEADIIFVPLNLGEMHWALGVIWLKVHWFEIVSSNKRMTVYNVVRCSSFCF